MRRLAVNALVNFSFPTTNMSYSFGMCVTVDTSNASNSEETNFESIFRGGLPCENLLCLSSSTGICVLTFESSSKYFSLKSEMVFDLFNKLGRSFLISERVCEGGAEFETGVTTGIAVLSF